MFAGCRCPREPDRVLKATKVGDRDVLGCRHCGGVFVDATLGLRLLAVLDSEVPSHDEQSPHPPCPVCRAAMKRVRPTNLDIDVHVCHRHGVWLDAADLALVLRAAAKALGKPVPSTIETLDRERAKAAAVTTAPGDDWSSLQTGHQPPTPNRPPPTPSSYSRGSAYGYGPMDVALGLVALPIEVSLAAVGAIGSLFD